MNISQLKAYVAELERHRDFWMSEGPDLCPEDGEYRKLAQIPQKKRTKAQTKELRRLANFVVDYNDVELLHKRIKELEANVQDS